jgi:hypothetical protein
MRVSQGDISAKLGFSKTNLTALHELLCAEAQLIVFLEYYESKKDKDGENGKRGKEKKSLVKAATSAYKARDSRYFGTLTTSQKAKFDQTESKCDVLSS